MLNLEEILSMWKEDAIIDDMKLDDSARDSAKLHGKYLELLSVAKLTKKKKDHQFKVLLKNKWLYYNGKMSKEEMDDLGWEYDPFKGLAKPLKGDMDRWYDADEHIQEMQGQIDYLDTIIDALKEILENVKWRHQNIKNIIEWRKFTSGL